jgi:multicomponent Na+:H+ antiporter subunit C
VNIMMALIVGVLYGTGLYMMMRRSIVKLIIGLALLSHGANLLIFLMGGLVRGNPPIITETVVQPFESLADPLSQALILTAIVIGFGVTAFAVVLIKRVHQRVGTVDLDALQSTDVT